MGVNILFFRHSHTRHGSLNLFGFIKVWYN